MKKIQNWNRRKLLTVAALPALVSAFTAGASAADSPTNSLPTNIDREYLDKLVNRMQSDEAELKSLKKEMAISQGTTPENTTPQFPTLQFHGFADVDYFYNSRYGAAGSTAVPFYDPSAKTRGNSFYLGEFDLFLQSQLAETWSVLTEDVISAGGDNHTGIDIERLELSWTPSEYFNVDLGRFHTQMGYYNTAYHHGTWFQNAVGRPWFLQFEDSGGLIPVHTVGVSMHGAIPSGSLNLAYYVEAGNGRDYTSSENNPVQNVFDNNGAKAVNLALVAKPDWLPGGQFGVGAYHDSVNPDSLPRTDEWIWNASFAYHGSLWEFMAEGYLVRHHVNGDGNTAHYSPMAFAQVARKFGLFTPYVRFTYVNASANDGIYTTILNQAGVQYGPSIGLRYDVSTYVALKLQYDYQHSTGYSDSSEITAQAAFTF